MGNYTPEELDAVALRLAGGSASTRDEIIAADVARAYAATLRQQAGRVDEEFDLRKYVRHMADVLEAGVGLIKVDSDLARLGAAIQAALAQNTQGEAVVTVGMFRGSDHTQDNYHGKGYGVTFSREDAGRLNDLPTGTKLYLHAERARVPDEADDEFVPRWWDTSHGDAYKEGWNDCRIAVISLAAAPSQRAEVK